LASVRLGLGKPPEYSVWAEEPPAARNRSPELTAAAPLPSVPDRGGPPVSAARGREPERAARASWAASVPGPAQS
jgi:hypothetical protein